MLRAAVAAENDMRQAAFPEDARQRRFIDGGHLRDAIFEAE